MSHHSPINVTVKKYLLETQNNMAYIAVGAIIKKISAAILWFACKAQWIMKNPVGLHFGVNSQIPLLIYCHKYLKQLLSHWPGKNCHVYMLNPKERIYVARKFLRIVKLSFPVKAKTFKFRSLRFQTNQ